MGWRWLRVSPSGESILAEGTWVELFNADNVLFEGLGLVIEAIQCRHTDT